MDPKQTDNFLESGSGGDQQDVQGDSLEYSDDHVDGMHEGVDGNNNNPPASASGAAGHNTDDIPAKKVVTPSIFKRLWQHFNIYLLVFILIIIIASVVVSILYFKNRTANIITPGTINQQNLPAETLQELASNGVQVGDPKQVLNVQSNSVFAGAVLVKGELQAAGGLKIGSGSLAIPEINVGGSATIKRLQSETVDVSGQTRSGELSVLRNLSVSGSGSFNGGVTTPTLSVGRLQLNGDLALSRHIVAGGATPNRSNGSALGAGGTSSVSGSDTAGSISINTGSGPAAGCFTTIAFANAFTSTPRVVITPVGSAAAAINYYINRDAGSFSVCTTSPAPGNAAFGFDYHIFN